MKYRVGIIGCGRIARLHMAGYEDPRCEVVSICDTNEEAARQFADHFELDADVFTDCRKMLRHEKLDVVSICLWPQLHLPVLRECVQAGARAVHCEKPMAPTWADACAMAESAASGKTQVTFNHRFRFRPNHHKAKNLLDEGEIGDLLRVEVFIHKHLLDMGTHLIDLLFMYNDDEPARWVMGQVDGHQLGQWYGIPHELCAFASIRFENGVHATVHCGHDNDDAIPSGVRLTGSKGVIEVRGENELRILRYDNGEWVEEELEDDGNTITMAGVMGDVIESLESRTKPALSVEHALQCTEVIFAIMESSRRRARIALPLKGVTDSPFLRMIEDGSYGKTSQSFYRDLKKKLRPRPGSRNLARQK